MSPMKTSHPQERAQFRDGSREMRALSRKGQECLRGRVLSHIPNPLVSELTSRRCLLETGLALAGEIQEHVP